MVVGRRTASRALWAGTGVGGGGEGSGRKDQARG